MIVRYKDLFYTEDDDKEQFARRLSIEYWSEVRYSDARRTLLISKSELRGIVLEHCKKGVLGDEIEYEGEDAGKEVLFITIPKIREVVGGK